MKEFCDSKLKSSNAHIQCGYHHFITSYSENSNGAYKTMQVLFKKWLIKINKENLCNRKKEVLSWFITSCGVDETQCYALISHLFILNKFIGLVGWLVGLDAIQHCHLKGTSFLNPTLECLHLVLDRFDRTLLIAVWSRGSNSRLQHA